MVALPVGNKVALDRRDKEVQEVHRKLSENKNGVDSLVKAFERVEQKQWSEE